MGRSCYQAPDHSGYRRNAWRCVHHLSCACANIAGHLYSAQGRASDRPYKDGDKDLDRGFKRRAFQVDHAAHHDKYGLGVEMVEPAGMSAVLPHPELTMQRPHWLAGAPGFEPGNGGIKIRSTSPSRYGGERSQGLVR